MGFCAKYLKNHVGYNSLWGLPFFTRSQLNPHGRIMKRIALAYQFFTELFQLVACIFCALAAPLVSDNIDVLCGCLSSVTHTLQIVVKTCHLKIHRKSFLKHLEELDNMLEKNSELHVPSHVFNFEEFFFQESRYVRLIQNAHMAAQFLSTSIYFVPLFFEGILSYVPGMFLPIVGYTPLDTSNQSGYLASFVFQMVAFYMFNTKMVVIDYFMMDIIVLHSTQIRFLGNVADALLEENRKGNMTESEREQYLRVWIRQHQKTMICTQNLRPLMSGYLIIEYLYAFVHTCIPAFVITSTNSWTVPQKTALFCMITSGMLVLFLLAAAGSALNAVGNEVEKILYGSGLLSWSTLQTTFRMFSCLNCRPPLLRFLSLFPLCFPTFLAISKLILTYYMTLNEVQTMKKGLD